ncbi:MAG: HEPN domain-containing protein [Actinomycetota bacterium]
MAQARRDLEAAAWAAKGGFHEWACFTAQQSAEKAAKAVFQKLGGESWGHSVAALLVGLREKVEVSDETVGLGRLLDRFYIPARYPNGWDDGSPKDFYTDKDSHNALSAAEEILRFCDGVLA